MKRKPQAAAAREAGAGSGLRGGGGCDVARARSGRATSASCSPTHSSSRIRQAHHTHDPRRLSRPEGLPGRLPRLLAVARRYHRRGRLRGQALLGEEILPLRAAPAPAAARAAAGETCHWEATGGLLGVRDGGRPLAQHAQWADWHPRMASAPPPAPPTTREAGRVRVWVALGSAGVAAMHICVLHGHPRLGGPAVAAARKTAAPFPAFHTLHRRRA